MKNTLVLLSILFTGISTFAQQSDQNEFKENGLYQVDEMAVFL